MNEHTKRERRRPASDASPETMSHQFAGSQYTPLGFAQPSASFSEAYLERICPMPQPFRWITDWERLHHQDIAELSDEELRREAYVARHRRMLDGEESRRLWLGEREAKCWAELDKRRGYYRRPISPPTPAAPRVVVRRAEEEVRP
jgi:hypothetical protein